MGSTPVEAPPRVVKPRRMATALANQRRWGEDERLFFQDFSILLRYLYIIIFSYLLLLFIILISIYFWLYSFFYFYVGLRWEGPRDDLQSQDGDEERLRRQQGM